MFICERFSTIFYRLLNMCLYPNRKIVDEQVTTEMKTLETRTLMKNIYYSAFYNLAEFFRTQIITFFILSYNFCYLLLFLFLFIYLFKSYYYDFCYLQLIIFFFILSYFVQYDYQL